MDGSSTNGVYGWFSSFIENSFVSLLQHLFRMAICIEQLTFYRCPSTSWSVSFVSGEIFTVFNGWKLFQLHIENGISIGFYLEFRFFCHSVLGCIHYSLFSTILDLLWEEKVDLSEKFGYAQQCFRVKMAI